MSRARGARLAAVALGAWLIGVATGLARAGHSAEPSVPTVRSDYVKRLLDTSEPSALVDFRKPAEYRAGHPCTWSASSPRRCWSSPAI